MRLSSVTRRPLSQIQTPQALPSDETPVRVARRTKAFIDGHFREPVRMKDLCRATGVGVRTVQRNFRQCFGVTVTSYLKDVRLDAAYHDLLAARPSHDSVTTIALQNGCTHLGRFSVEFRQRFGQLPREALRANGQRSASPTRGDSAQSRRVLRAVPQVHRRPTASLSYLHSAGSARAS